MKHKKFILGFLAVFLFVGVGTAQNKEQKEWITRHYDLSKSAQLSDAFSKKYYQERDAAYAYARAHNLPLVTKDEDGTKSYLYRMTKNGELIYRKAYSRDQSKTINVDPVYPGASLSPSLTGQGMTAAVWDGGKVRGSHELLDGKIIYGDGAIEYDDHATHVAGIMVGKELLVGNGYESRGMAYEADLTTYDWNNDLSEMSSAAGQGLLVSNHSYGLDLSLVSNPDNFLGRYDGGSAGVDQIAFNASYYTIVTAAGNDRQAGYSYNGYNILGGEMATAKNTIVVAAVKSMSNYNNPSSVKMSSFSSWGPTRDKRIKPDISADGVSVISSIAHDGSGNVSDNSYANLSGTSMASPSVAGAVILLQELSSDLNNGVFLHSATIKAVMIQTAREAGSNAGPDPKFGWGLLNVADAAQLMVDSHNEENGAYYKELSLHTGNTYTTTIKADGGEPLKVTIAWTDPAGNDQGPSGDSSVLIHDLDLRVKDSQGNTYYPWRLDENNDTAPAKNDGDNAVDNVEQVFIENPDADEDYTIEVSHKGMVLLGSDHQDFSLVAQGGQSEMSVSKNKLEDYNLYPNPAQDQFNLDLKDAANSLSVQVYDMNGRVVIDNNYTGGSLNHSIDVSGLSNGIYFVKLNADGKIGTEKLIIK